MVSIDGATVWLRRIMYTAKMTVVSFPSDLLKIANLRRGALVALCYRDGVIYIRSLDAENIWKGAGKK